MDSFTIPNIKIKNNRHCAGFWKTSEPNDHYSRQKDFKIINFSRCEDGKQHLKLDCQKKSFFIYCINLISQLHIYWVILISSFRSDPFLLIADRHSYVGIILTSSRSHVFAFMPAIFISIQY